mmetsp:Transcript_1533/g.2466  ORF Transcript_1533/g.2466 Transcript_1533/m.2466 type:complete len:313 (+) Transcript_1533:42-980(+)
MKHCSECDEDYDVEDEYCHICGAKMESVSPPEAQTEHTEEDMFSQLSSILDIFGVDFQDDIQAALSQSQVTAISREYASSLGKVTVDRRGSILYNCSISMGPLKLSATTSEFNILPFERTPSAPLVLGQPLCGESEFANGADIAGAIVFVKRGIVTFATKVKHAMNAGAVGVIVHQTAERWPFVMTDSSQELQGIDVNIPVLMVNESDGNLLTKLLEAKNRNTQSVSLLCTKGATECSICHDDMHEGEVVLKLPCSHVYHNECVMGWLTSHNTCPLCRHELPAASRQEQTENMRQQRGRRDENAAHRQAFMV